ncbi:MAG: TPM domain-containing protein [Proteobacteria bacterium]|nr:TPM domain-containing protein [Pseudomonadota bacterium]
MINKYNKFLFGLHSIVLLLFFIWITNIHCTTISKTPKIDSWVNDSANILSKEDQSKLSNILNQYHNETHHQIVILIVPTLSGETIEDFSLRVAKANGIGYKGYDNGILITLAVKEKKVRIELGKGMEPYISNSTAKMIIVTKMTPYFAKDDFATGLENGLNQLMEKAREFVIKDELLLKK